MVTKIIACADIHIPSLKGIDDLRKVLSSFIEEAKNIAKENGKANTRIVVAGDIFHNKIAITNESIVTAHWFLSELGKVCKTIVIGGNHDMLINNSDRLDSLTSIFEIGSPKNVVYLDKELEYKSGCYEDDNIVWSLFSSFDGFVAPNIKAEKITHPDSTFVGLIHGDIKGAESHTGFSTENGIEPSFFSDCAFVIAGHIHKFQEIRQEGVKIVYCSSINQKNFGETIYNHGFVLWDISGEEPEYDFVEIENPDSGYFKFSINSINDIEEDYEELINL